jgi:hypothetical protein
LSVPQATSKKMPINPVEIEKRIFSTANLKFNEIALDIFHFQLENCTVFRNWIGQFSGPSAPLSPLSFLPISLFKSHRVVSFNQVAQAIFESSSTTGQIPSRHFVANLSLYEKSFTLGFESIYGKASEYKWLCLLPGYLERQNSSLVYMACREAVFFSIKPTIYWSNFLKTSPKCSWG